MRLCSLPGCGKPHEAKGLCPMHRRRQKLGQDLHAPERASRGTLPDFVTRALGYAGDNCLIWPWKLKPPKMYPTIKLDHGPVRVNRHICELIHGPAPTKKHQAAHRCGNRLCVAPAHLRWTNAKENAADKLRHGTVLRGARNHLTKLTEADVRAIRAQQHCRTQDELAAEYGVTQVAISKIFRRKTWRWLDLDARVTKIEDDLRGKAGG